MSGGGSTKQTTSGSNAPWKEAQPGLKYGIGEAQNLYKAGIGAQPYTKSTVVPYSQQTMGAIDTTMQKAAGAQDNAMKPWNAMGQQMDYLSPLARGDFRRDKTFNQTLGRAQDDAQNAVNMGAASAGRYGSAVHQGNVSREIGDLTNRAMLDRQNWAQTGMMNTAAAMPGAYSTAFLPESSQMAMGSMLEDLQARTMQDEARVFAEQQNLPWDNLGRFNAIMGGAGAMGGNQTSTVSTPKSYGTAFGNALTGAGYGSQMGAPLLGAGLGFLSGM